MADWVDLIDEGDLEPGDMTEATAGNKTLLVSNVHGTFYVCDGTCTHAGGPLADGSLSGKVVTCPWHGSRFDVSTGAVLGAPANRPLHTYPCRVENGKVQAEV